MSGRVLTANVWVEDRLYTVGMTRGVGVPDDVAAKIGDHAWSQPVEDTDTVAGGVSGAGPEADPGTASGAADAAEDAAEGPVAGEQVEPPRAGRGSSRDAWAAYAATVGVTVGADDTRDDIIAAVDAATA